MFVTLNIMFVVPSALNGSDFGKSTNTAGFFFPYDSTNATVCVLITIIDDDKLEDNETFFMNVTLVRSDLLVSVDYDFQPLFIIIDNDGQLHNKATNFFCFFLEGVRVGTDYWYRPIAVDIFSRVKNRHVGVQ